MSERSKNRKKELEDFLRYSQDQMSEEERNAFERSLEQDPFDAEAMEGLSSITSEEVRADMAGLQNKIQNRIAGQSETKPNTRTMWYRVAAAVAVLLVVTSVLFTLFNDRMGELDRKVAESPELEKETVAPVPPDEITPVSKVDKAETEAPKRKESDMFKSVKVEKEAEVESEIISEEIIDERLDKEELAREEPAEIQIKETEEADMAVAAEESHVDEVAAPAPAIVMERPASAKSMKREMVEPLQGAGAVAEEQRSISGTVISGEDELPLPGAMVALKGSKTGAVTDFEGSFQIFVENDSQNTIIAQYIGMESKEISIQDQEELVISLEPDVINLEEVVIITSAPKMISQTTGYAVALAEPDEDQDKSEYRNATPVGGKKKFNDYVKSNIQFPEHDDDLTRAVVVLNFVAGYDGRPAQVLVLKSPAKVFSDEAIRLLVEGPDWKPAEVNGAIIEQVTRIRIVFKKD